MKTMSWFDEDRAREEINSMSIDTIMEKLSIGRSIQVCELAEELLLEQFRENFESNHER